MITKTRTHLHVSLHLSEDVDVDVNVDDGKISLNLVTVSLSNPRATSFFDLHGDTEQMERIVAALEQGLNEVLREQVSERLSTRGQGYDPDAEEEARDRVFSSLGQVRVPFGGATDDYMGR